MLGEHIAIETSLEPELRHVRVDPNAIVQVIINLAINGRDAMPGGHALSYDAQLGA